MNKDSPSPSVQMAQLQIAPKLPGAGDNPQAPTPSLPTPSLPGSPAPAVSPSLPGGSPAISPSLPGGSGPSVSPSLPGGSAPSVTPSLPGGLAPSLGGTSPAPAAPVQAGGGSNLKITIANPDKLPSLPAGNHELKLVIQSDGAQAAPPAKEVGLGFIEVFAALVLALVIAPVVQREAGKWFEGLNAFDFVKKNGLVISTYLICFSMGWIIFMIVLPQLNMLDFSFRFSLPPDEVGGPNDVYTLKNYKYLIFGRPGSDELLNWLHLQVFFKTIVASVIVTLINFAMCYPLAYYMAQSVSGSSQRLLFLCLLLPFWVNEILRAFAFKLIFAQQGILNTVLMGLGLFDTPFDFFKADIALYTGLTYAYLLLMIFPLYNAIESLDHNQVEAARDMGASWVKIHLRVVMPHAKPGIASGCTMVFMLSAGALAAPQILGGPSSLWFTQIIQQWYNTGGNWPQGSAYAFVLLVVCIIFVQIVMRVFKVSLGEIAQR